MRVPSLLLLFLPLCLPKEHRYTFMGKVNCPIKEATTVTIQILQPTANFVSYDTLKTISLGFKYFATFSISAMVDIPEEGGTVTLSAYHSCYGHPRLPHNDTIVDNYMFYHNTSLAAAENATGLVKVNILSGQTLVHHFTPPAANVVYTGYISLHTAHFVFVKSIQELEFEEYASEEYYDEFDENDLEEVTDQPVTPLNSAPSSLQTPLLFILLRSLLTFAARL
ncbi:hypothetical protein PFISCL1PPCAC_26911 [Pristionchus fissidentatus]|uniref:Uncharacterized protein n=1 Tax=Pristionchus fissidentatus TaxID=1538716 RepID=A0AAV5WTV5_9BILA|nr:hypothetical protein PFISCL1PPCAC_26911 [Pristionchus fissidentatus]